MPYIEDDFPFEEIDVIAWSESNARKPISHFHKWFARRVGSTFRALILSTFLDINPMEYYYQKNELKREDGAPIILDPFMGGGTTIIEGRRLGCKMIGIDINPIAWFITKTSLTPWFNLETKKKIEWQFKRIKNALKNKILIYYKTLCQKNHEANIMYVFWVKTIKCENCYKNIPLYKSFKLATPPKKAKWAYYCPKCGDVFWAKTHLLSVQCPACANTFNPNDGIAPKKSRYQCPHCNYEGDTLRAVQKTDQPPKHEIYAIEYYCSKCGRDYKKPDKQDHEHYLRVKEKFENKKQQWLGKLIPDQIIPLGEKTKEALNYNYKRFYQMFNERQLFCLGLIFDEILKINNPQIREFFLITFSDSLNANNLFTIYNRTALKLEPLFGGHHFWPPGSPIEGNVWGAVFGRGTFEKYYKKSLRAVNYQENPYEVRYQIKIGKNGKKKHERIKETIENENITGNFGDTFEELCNSKNILLKCATAEDLSFIPDGMIDAVISDPPYYDNIMYSELSDFFYVWLRLGLKDLYPEVFNSRFTIKDREILVSKTQGKLEEFYIEGMVNVFKEAHRVLKSKGLMIFVFQHKKVKAWSALLKALLRANFYVIAAYPTHGETPSGVRAYGMNYNSILVCKKLLDTDQKQLSPMEVENHLRTTIEKEIARILNRRPSLTVEDGFILGMGKGLQIYSQNYVGFSKNKEELEVSGFYMEQIRDIAFNSFLKCISAWVPNIDRLSQIYLSIFANKDKIASETLRSLRIYENSGVNIFEEEKLLKRIKKKKLLDVLHPNQRIEFINQKFDKNVPLNYIDAAHLLWSTWESKEKFERALERISKTEIEPNILREYIKFLGKRTDYVIWKRIEKVLTS
ncbi:MAG: hypothetical protein ACFFC7_34695 [Candidatus Hermodarchaeota archaeon]